MYRSKDISRRRRHVRLSLSLTLPASFFFPERVHDYFVSNTTVNPSTVSIKVDSQNPSVAATSFVAPNSCVAGDVSFGKDASVWYGASIRANGASVRIGANSSIHERACVTASTKPTVIGTGVSVGANAQVHSCELHDECVIGSNVRLLDGAVVKRHAVVAPGSLVDANQVIPSGQLWSGSPAVFARELNAEEVEAMKRATEDVLELAEAHAYECSKTFEEMESEKWDAEYQERLRSPHYFDPAIEDGRSGRFYESNH